MMAEPTQLDSIYMGCVSWTKRFFTDGSVTKEAMDDAMDDAVDDAADEAVEEVVEEATY